MSCKYCVRWHWFGQMGVVPTPQGFKTKAFINGELFTEVFSDYSTLDSWTGNGPVGSGTWGSYVFVPEGAVVRLEVVCVGYDGQESEVLVGEFTSECQTPQRAPSEAVAPAEEPVAPPKEVVIPVEEPTVPVEEPAPTDSNPPVSAYEFPPPPAPTDLIIGFVEFVN